MPKQTVMEGTKCEQHEDVTNAAIAYRKLRDERQQLQQGGEFPAKDALVAAMRKHELTVYEDTDAKIRVTITDGKVKLKVKTIEEPKSE